MLLISRGNSIRYMAVFAAALATSGCGSAEKQEAKVIPRHVVTSAIDCQEAASFTYDECTALIEKAVAAHDSSATSFTTLKACEAKEGPDKCERIDDRVFRPRLVAFLLTMSEPPVVEPLYVSQGEQVGFRTAGATVLAIEDEKYSFTKSAVEAAEALVSKRKGGGGGGGIKL